ncbi:hypothetical protein ES705_20375 [subsurface metagenome]
MKKDFQMANLGSVIPRCDCQNSNPVGAHWLRNSFDSKVLEKVKAWVSRFFGESTLNDYGMLSYGRHYSWQSGVSLCFDDETDPEHNPGSHRGRMTLDVPGKACDSLTASDLLLFMEGCQDIGCKCTRIDVFWDDYNRIVSFEELRRIADEGDFSGFQISSENRTKNRTRKENGGLIYDAVTFGRRGCKGSGKYLRAYDKNLESKGESDCIRWECEFSQEKAQEVFTWLVGADGNLDVFASLCGALIGGCINFVHRKTKEGEKHIARLDVYEWWQEIIDSLGVLSVRIAKKVNTLAGTIEWVKRQVSPSLALVRKAMKSEQDFYNFMSYVLKRGESRMNTIQCQIAEQNAGCLTYDRKFNKEKQESDYLNAMCVQVS